MVNKYSSAFYALSNCYRNSCTNKARGGNKSPLSFLWSVTWHVWMASLSICLHFPSRIVMWLSKMVRIYITDNRGLSHCNVPPKLLTNRIDPFRLLCVKLGYRYGGRLNVPLISSDKSCSSTSGNKTEKKTLKEIMESCQDLDILIVACTIVCVLQILCLCLLRKTRNHPGYMETRRTWFANPRGY